MCRIRGRTRRDQGRSWLRAGLPCESLDITRQALRSIALDVVTGIAVHDLRGWDSAQKLTLVSLLEHRRRARPSDKHYWDRAPLEIWPQRGGIGCRPLAIGGCPTVSPAPGAIGLLCGVVENASAQFVYRPVGDHLRHAR